MEYNPDKNPDVVSLIIQTDGNWKGEQRRFGRLISVRGSNPMSVLQALLTHDGKVDAQERIV